MSRDDYEERQKRRKSHLLIRAQKAESEGQAACDEATRIARLRPFGQPILVGHHSERSARADQRRIDRNMSKAVGKSAQAEELKRRADCVGKGGISSDDPEAVQKLRDKLEGLKRRHETRKRVNAAWQKAGKPSANDADAWRALAGSLQLTSDDVERIRLGMARDWRSEPRPFPTYVQTNTNAELRRLKRRIEELESAAEHEVDREEDCGVCRIVESTAENRIQLYFDGKPEESVRRLLKRNGFRWSPRNVAWQRLLNDAGRRAARCVVLRLGEGGE